MQKITINESTLVSIIMPVKQGKYLYEAVASLSQQQHRAIELIVIDDGCDKSDLAKIYPLDKRIVIIANRGKGLIDALNTGLACAKGDIIARMDADDIATPDRFSAQLDLLAKMPENSIVAGKVEIFKTEGEVDTGNKLYQAWLNSLITSEDIERELFIESPLPHPTIVMPRHVVQQVGVYRDGPWPEDYDYWLRAYSTGTCFAKPEPVILYWRDESDRTSRNDPRYDRACFMNLKASYVSSLINERSLYIWGTGQTGLNLHDALTEHQIDISGFIDVHPRRIGKLKRGIPVYSYTQYPVSLEGVVLVAVSVRGVREKIRHFMNDRNKLEGKDFWFFA